METVDSELLLAIQLLKRKQNASNFAAGGAPEVEISLEKEQWVASHQQEQKASNYDAKP